jgi:hypothetical protein
MGWWIYRAKYSSLAFNSEYNDGLYSVALVLFETKLQPGSVMRSSARFVVRGVVNYKTDCRNFNLIRLVVKPFGDRRQLWTHCPR